jgi:nickel-dependent lactate racemase
MLYFERGSATDRLSADDLRAGLHTALARLGLRQRVLVVPPDFTRFHSQAGRLTRLAYDYYGPRLTDVLPALGTHTPMTPEQIEEMFAGVPAGLFRVHNWRTGVANLGEVPGSFVHEVSEGAVDFPWPVQLANLIWNGGHDLILSIGQVVPHEVIGMANHNKNLFIGAGGPDSINRSHFVGAAYGMERMMGRADTPVRRILNYAGEHFTKHLPIVYVHTVVSRDPDGSLQVRGLYVGDDAEVFNRAAALSLQVNFQMVEHPLKKVVVYLDPAEFKSTWLGNKSIYRTRMALADGGELIVLAPGLKEFGEDAEIDRLIRKYGYRGTPATLAAVKADDELRQNLGAAAHLIHGSSEGRFNITYCPGHLTRQEIEDVGFRYAGLAAMTRRYDPTKLKDGWNTMPDGEPFFYISNPALGLWAHRGRFSPGEKT